MRPMESSDLVQAAGVTVARFLTITTANLEVFMEGAAVAGTVLAGREEDMEAAAVAVVITPRLGATAEILEEAEVAVGEVVALVATVVSALAAAAHVAIPLAGTAASAVAVAPPI